MKPGAFEYLAPESLEEALEALAQHGDEASVLAGGQSLVPMMNMRLASPALLIDIMRIAELREISSAGGWTEIGAGVRMTQAELESGIDLLQRALGHVAHPAIRNSGTICGSVAHADPAAEVPAVLLALDGAVVLASSRGRRVVAASEFFHSYFVTAREPDELVIAVRFANQDRRVAFAEVSPRLAGSTGEFASAGVAMSAQFTDDGCFGNVSFALLAAADRPIRVPEVEAFLLGLPPTKANIAETAELAATSVTPLVDVHSGRDYRRQLIRTLTRKALVEVGA